MHKLELNRITKIFQKTIAVDNFNLNVRSGEFLSVLGPSGCGKTTVLRIIAGFVTPNKGNVIINGKIVNDIPPRSRNIGMVFQNYALFPHMTVFGNISFGLKVEKLNRAEIHKKVEEVLAIVKLSGFEDRHPEQLSGGQQQRVALARALVKNPEILLLDEPLSNLDAKLRKQMRDEIRIIQRNLGITAVFVTHDQEEALSMSDRVVVMQQGKIIQIGTPKEIYEKPDNAFVADFIGHTNIISGNVVSSQNNKIMLKLSEKIALEINSGLKKYKGKKLKFSIRPDRIEIAEAFPSSSINVFPAKVLSNVYMGLISSYNISIFNQMNLFVIKHNVKNTLNIQENDEYFVQLNPEDLVLLNE